MVKFCRIHSWMVTNVAYAAACVLVMPLLLRWVITDRRDYSK